MPAAEFRVFLSAVTSEFGRARDALAADLRSRGLLVRVQSDFRQEAGADTTLRKLHDYIRDCAAVVCVVGTRSGACPPPDAAAPFVHMLPPGVAEASYTQWEFFFARHHGRRLSIYVADADHVPDRPAPNGPDRPDLQRALVRHIVVEKGLDRSVFSNADQLCRAVLKEDWEGRAAARPQVLPYLSLGGLFKGREEALEALRRSLHRPGGGLAAVTGGAVQGLGGIGKTRAAVEYAWRHYYDHTALLFVVANTPEALGRNLAALAGVPLGLPEAAAPEQEMRLKAVIDWLATHPGWLLILDNVDDREALAVAEAMLGRMAGGQAVVTTRLRNLPAAFARVRLGVLEPEAATTFLLDRTAEDRRKEADDAAQARALAKELGYLALALEHAGAFICQGEMTFRAYREEWRGNRAEVLAWSDPALTHYPRKIAVTWQTSVARLSAAGRALLERLAWLGPEPIPEALLEVAVPGAAEDENLRKALADLSAYSLVTRAETPEFTVHRLVQDVTRRSLAGDAPQRRLREALGWLTAAFTGDPQDIRNWPRLDLFAPHAQAVVGFADAGGLAEPASRLRGEVALLRRAKELYREALTTTERALRREHPDVAVRLNNLANLLRDTGRLTEAEPLYREALTTTERALRREHPDVAVRLNNLANLLRDTGRLTEAEPLLREVLAAGERALGRDHPIIAVLLGNLANLLRDTGRSAEGEQPK